MFVFPTSLPSPVVIRRASNILCLVTNFDTWQLVSVPRAQYRHCGFFLIDYRPQVILLYNYVYNYFDLSQYMCLRLILYYDQ